MKSVGGHDTSMIPKNAQSTERIAFIKAIFCIGSTGISMICTPLSAADSFRRQQNCAGFSFGGQSHHSSGQSPQSQEC